MRQNIDNKEIEMATKALELERRGSSSFTFVKHFVSQERHYNKALELACSYLTDEQVRDSRRLTTTSRSCHPTAYARAGGVVARSKKESVGFS